MNKPIKLAAFIAMFWGMHFACLQSAYFFLLEVLVSSQAFAYLIVLLCWISGSIFGLRRPGKLLPWLVLSLVSYYISLSVAWSTPFVEYLLWLTSFSAVVSGVCAGVFFNHAQLIITDSRKLLFHENNGFLVGLVISLICSVWMGESFLRWFALLSVVPCLFTLTPLISSSEYGQKV